MSINKEKILTALRSVIDGDKDVVSAGRISSLVIKGNSVGFAIEIDMNNTPKKEDLRKKCEDSVKKLEGIDKVTAVLTSKKLVNFQNKTTGKQTHPRSIPGVKNIIVVASGKGGVGKSTMAVNLATSLTDKGFKVGICDLDIYGPSIPKMLGVSGKPESDEEKRMLPHEKNGIKSISIGYLVDEEKAVVWRSSMALKAMAQLMSGVKWGALDYLIIDTPPGTGDIHLSLAKGYAINGVIIVSTPQDVALADVKKSINMFSKVKVPILGIIENMSYFEDDSGKKNYIFGRNGARKLAKSLNIPFLGELPILQKIREAADSGTCLKNNSDIDRITCKFISELEK